MARMLYDHPLRRRNLFDGPGFIAGIAPGLVTVQDAPAAREVEVRHRNSRIVVATTFSAPDGTFVVHRLDPALEFDVIARDWQRNWQDVIVGAIKPWPYGA